MTSNTAVSELNGKWELTTLPGAGQEFSELYAEKKPTLEVNIAEKRINGNSSCNVYSGPLAAENGKISFKGPIAATKMACANNNGGETAYFKALDQVDAYKITDKNTLHLLAGETIIASFTRK